MQETNKLYFVALLPDDNTCKLVADYKQVIYRQFACKAALKSPAHITLVPPFMMNNAQLEQVMVEMKKISSTATKFRIQTEGWNHFTNRTIYLDCQNSQYLAKIHARCQELAMQIGINISQRNFIPHITLANRDINAQQYDSLWEIVNNMDYPKSVIIDSLVIFEQTPNQWHPLLILPLAANENI